MENPPSRGSVAGIAAVGAPGSDNSAGQTPSTPGPADLIAFDSGICPLAFLGDLIGRYGDVVRYRTRFGVSVLFVHPEHVRTILHSGNFRRASLVKMMLGDGLLASEGSRWRSQRRLMQPDFLPARISPMVAIMNRETSRTAEDWLKAAHSHQALDITEAMTRLTLRIIVDALFSNDLSGDGATELCSAITRTIKDLGQIAWTAFGAPVQFTPQRNASFLAAKQVIDAACYDMISRRRAQAANDRPRDLLTLLIEAPSDGGPIADVQIRDELVTMLVGGHETTALALAWTWKALAEHPDVEAQLYREVDAVLPDGIPRVDNLPDLTWTRSVFQEGMRLYPPVWHMARVAVEDDIVHGHAIPRGACVLLSAWFTHRHPDFWREPERFDPARFSNPACPLPHRYAYFPFGGGRHQCLGMNFALSEGVVILARLARQFRVRPITGQLIQPAPGITLRQSPAMQAYIEERAQLGAAPGSNPSETA